MIHYQCPNVGTRCGVDGDASTEWPDVTCLACLFRDARTLPRPEPETKPKRVGLRRRITSAGLLLAVAFGASACGYDQPSHGDWYQKGADLWCFDTEVERSVDTTCVTSDSNPGIESTEGTS